MLHPHVLFTPQRLNCEVFNSTLTTIQQASHFNFLFITLWNGYGSLTYTNISQKKLCVILVTYQIIALNL